MLTGKQVQGKPLISLTDGKKVGEVRDLYLDETLTRLTGVFIGAEGLINRKNMAVGRDSIQLLGIDAWLVRDPHVVLEPEALPDWSSYMLVSTLRGREIMTEGGTHIGSVDDVIFDRSGQIVGFALGRIKVQGTLAERKAIARVAISTVGGKDSAMTANMALAETTLMPED